MNGPPMTTQADTVDCQFPDGKLAYSIKRFADLTDFGRSTIYEAIKDGSLVFCSQARLADGDYRA